MKILSIGKQNTVSSKGKFTGQKFGDGITKLEKPYVIVNDYHSASAEVYAYYNTKAVYVPSSWEKKADIPKTHMVAAPCLLRPYSEYSEFYDTSHSESVTGEVFIDTAMTLKESLKEKLSKEKTSLAYINSSIERRDKERTDEWKRIQERDADSLGAKISSFFDGGYHRKSRKEQLSTYDRLCREIESLKKEKEESESDIRTISVQINSIERAEKYGDLIDISRRNVDNPNAPLVDFLKEKQKSQSKDTKWMTEMQVALPDKMVSLSSLIKDSFAGQGYDTSNTTAFISRAMKSDSFIYRIEQNLFKTIENNDW